MKNNQNNVKLQEKKTLIYCIDGLDILFGLEI